MFYQYCSQGCKKEHTIFCREIGLKFKNNEYKIKFCCLRGTGWIPIKRYNNTEAKDEGRIAISLSYNLSEQSIHKIIIELNKINYFKSTDQLIDDLKDCIVKYK